MKTLGNVIWILFGGIFTAALWLLLGVILCITIIGIPFGKQCFKFAKITLTPFGKDIAINFQKHPIINVIWIIFFGWELALSYVIAGAFYCITIIGIPFGMQSFKFAKLALVPFGATVEQVA